MFKLNTEPVLKDVQGYESRLSNTYRSTNGEKRSLDFLVKKYLLTGYRHDNKINSRFYSIDTDNSKKEFLFCDWFTPESLALNYANILPVAGKNFKLYREFERYIQRSTAFGITLEKCELCKNYCDTEDCTAGLDGVRYCKKCAFGKYERCVECGNVVEWQKNTGKPYCDSCVESLGLVYCDLCNEWYPVEDCEEVETDKFLCNDCRESAFCCEGCGEWVDENNIVFVGDNCYCDDCLDKYALRCSDCDEYFLIDASYSLSDDSCNICPHCAENYIFCENCDSIIHIDSSFSFGDRTLCESCYDDAKVESTNALILSYHTSVGLKFHHCDEASKLYFGVELEYDLCHVNDVEESVKAIAGKFDIENDYTDLHLEHDSSISAFEAVFQPRTLASWQTWKELGNFTDAVEALDANYSTGMHIHVSKSAMSDSHKSAFTFFLNYHTAFVEKIAERPENSYSKFTKKTTSDFHNGNFANLERHEAVNWQNSRTVEVRVFQSTQNTDTIIARVEFLHAVYQFTKKSSIKACRSLKNFIAYVSNHKKYSTFCDVYNAALISKI